MAQKEVALRVYKSDLTREKLLIKVENVDASKCFKILVENAPLVKTEVLRAPGLTAILPVNAHEGWRNNILQPEGDRVVLDCLLPSLVAK